MQPVVGRPEPPTSMSMVTPNPTSEFAFDEGYDPTKSAIMDPADLSRRFNGADMRADFDGTASNFRDIMALRMLTPPNVTVCDAQLMGSGPSKHHAYRVKGNDHYGDLEVFRRYREFDKLRQLLQDRNPGLFIPPLPEKKSVNKTHKLFVQERMFFLDRFIKDIS